MHYHTQTSFLTEVPFLLFTGEVLDPSLLDESSTRTGSDPAGQGVPVFLQEPEETYYIIKGKPVTVTCQAMTAVSIHFKCVGQWVRPSQYVKANKVDEATGEQYLQTSLEVSKDEVEEYFGEEDYWCECYAWNNGPGANTEPQTTKSRRGTVQVACKYFDVFGVV